MQKTQYAAAGSKEFYVQTCTELPQNESLCTLHRQYDSIIASELMKNWYLINPVLLNLTPAFLSIELVTT